MIRPTSVGLDRLSRVSFLARHGFPYMLDAGIGHGAGDFEGIQFGRSPKDSRLSGLWSDRRRGEQRWRRQKKDSFLHRAGLSGTGARCRPMRHGGFAEASVAVPFVGAAAGALTVAQLIRLASLEPGPLLFQMGLGAPGMPTLGGLTARPETNLGSFSIRL